MEYILDDLAWDLTISGFLKFSDVILWFCLPPLFPSFLFSNFAKSSQLRSYWLRLFSPPATPAQDRIRLNKVFFGEKIKIGAPEFCLWHFSSPVDLSFLSFPFHLRPTDFILRIFSIFSFSYLPTYSRL